MENCKHAVKAIKTVKDKAWTLVQPEANCSTLLCLCFSCFLWAWEASIFRLDACPFPCLVSIFTTNTLACCPVREICPTGWGITRLRLLLNVLRWTGLTAILWLDAGLGPGLGACASARQRALAPLSKVGPAGRCVTRLGLGLGRSGALPSAVDGPDAVAAAAPGAGSSTADGASSPFTPVFP